MSGAEVKAAAGRITSLSDLGPYEFWSRELIGATEADFQANERGELSPQRREELACAGLAARERLAEMDVPGVQGWMSAARRIN